MLLFYNITGVFSFSGSKSCFISLPLTYHTDIWSRVIQIHLIQKLYIFVSGMHQRIIVRYIRKSLNDTFDHLTSKYWKKTFWPLYTPFYWKKIVFNSVLLNSVYGAGNYHVNKNSFIPIVTFVLNSFEQKEWFCISSKTITIIAWVKSASKSFVWLKRHFWSFYSTVKDILTCSNIKEHEKELK